MLAGDPALETFAACARRLDLQWEVVTNQWRDRIRDDFARQHYAPLQQEHKRMADAAAALAAALHEAQQTVR